MLGFKLDLFELIEGIRDGIFEFIKSFLWSLFVLIRHPIRAPRFLAMRYRSAKYVQIGPFAFITTFVFCALLMIASFDQFPGDASLTTLSGQPVTTTALDYLDLLSTPNAVLLLLAAALFAILLQGFQWVFFRRLQTFSSKMHMERFLASLTFSSCPVLLMAGLSFSVFAPLIVIALLFSGQIEFLGQGETNDLVIALALGGAVVISVMIGSLSSVKMVRLHMTRAQKAGTMTAAPLSKRAAVLRCATPYLVALALSGTAVANLLPQPPRIWISHVKCAPETTHMSAHFVIANQTSSAVLVPRDYFDLELTPDYDGFGGAAGAGLVSALFGTAHNVRGAATFSLHDSLATDTAILLEPGKTYHGALHLDLDSDMQDDMVRVRKAKRGTMCRIHSRGRQNAQLVENAQFEYRVDPDRTDPDPADSND